MSSAQTWHIGEADRQLKYEADMQAGRQTEKRPGSPDRQKTKRHTERRPAIKKTERKKKNDRGGGGKKQNTDAVVAEMAGGRQTERR